ncbi:hypothetical protein INR49_011030, partial [Caranx melampygus]
GRTLSHITTSSSYAHTELRKRTHTLCFGAQQRKLRTCTFVSSYHLSSCSPQAQATLSAAVGLTMPQHTQHSLISVLLLWTTVLSIVQVAFIIFFFTAGHHSPCQNCTAGEAKYTKQYQANNATSPPPESNLILGKMLTYQATYESSEITEWYAKDPDIDLISEKGKVLTINRDGYYLLNLQVTLSSCKDNQTVQVEWNNKVLLLGWINNKTCSTGILSKAELLSAGGTLSVIIQPKNPHINSSEFLTYMDIIFMSRP